jgi:hypothetical protein
LCSSSVYIVIVVTVAVLVVVLANVMLLWLDTR